MAADLYPMQKCINSSLATAILTSERLARRSPKAPLKPTTPGLADTLRFHVAPVCNDIREKWLK
jgi:hypothetical protein